MEFFSFGLGHDSEADITVLGGKGHGLTWMSKAGIPVPPGFVIPTTVWAEYAAKPKTTMKAIAKALPEWLAKLEKHFGYRPLLSVRSGARVSCPGMMDTILNVGIDVQTEAEWSDRLGKDCLIDSYHRLVVMYGSVVKGINRQSLENGLMQAFHVYQKETNEAFPDAEGQLLGAMDA